MGINGKISNFHLCGDVRVVLTLPSKDQDLTDFSPPFLSGMKVNFHILHKLLFLIKYDLKAYFTKYFFFCRHIFC